MIDLNTLIDQACGLTLGVATGINEKSWIVGEGRAADGSSHAFLLIPEPSTILLFAFGGFLLRKNNGSVKNLSHIFR
jgi:hypothetical protein